MNRAIGVLGAPSSIGMRPYEDGEARNVDRAPDVLRERGLIERLGAHDFGDVIPPPYRDYVRPARGIRNQESVIAYSRSLGERLAAATANGQFAVVLGGDCSIVLGCLMGARRHARGAVGLAYLDAHADFATPAESTSGSVAGMSLALAVGRGDTPLARLAGRAPLIDSAHVVLIGRRDGIDAGHGHSALAASHVVDMQDSDLLTQAPADVAAASLTHLAAAGVRGFWIQLDADVLNPVVMSAVDSPVPGGPMPHELVALLQPLVHHPMALGLSVTVYDPAFDADRSCARRLVSLLQAVLE